MTKDDIELECCGCDAVLRLGRDCEFSCMLAKNHSGPHYDEFTHGDNTVAVVWHSEKFAVSLAGENAT